MLTPFGPSSGSHKAMGEVHRRIGGYNLRKCAVLATANSAQPC
jgi:hypothetical protein